MPEFLPVLITGAVLLIVLLGIFAFPFSSPSGFFTANTQNRKYNHIPLFDGKTISMKTFSVTDVSGEITSKEKTMVYTFKADPSVYKTGMIEFIIKDTNNYGKIYFILNNEVIYSGFPEIGRHWKRFGTNILKEDNILEVRVEDPGLRFWTETKYDFQLKISGAIESEVKKTFSLDSPKNPKLLFGFDSKRGNMIIELNGERIYEGDMEEDILELDEGLLKEKNTIEFSASPGSRFDIDWAEITTEK